MRCQNPYLPSLSPSGIYLSPKPDPASVRLPSQKLGEPMLVSEIEAVIAAFGEAAETAQRLGFDAVEIHGAHGYLIDQFFWAETNRRTERLWRRHQAPQPVRGRDRAGIAAAASGPTSPSSSASRNGR